MNDPLSEVIELLQPRAVFSRRISGAGRWGVAYSAFGDSGIAPIDCRHEQLTAIGLSVYALDLRGRVAFLDPDQCAPRQLAANFRVGRLHSSRCACYFCERCLRTRLIVSGDTPRYEASIR
jgi:hypothetical protein